MGKTFIISQKVYLASLCTLKFNTLLKNYLSEEYQNKMPLFDCRVFYVPSLMEAYNVFLWREQDATRNSIQMAGQAQFSHNELQNKNCDEIQEMLFQQKGINWNNYEDWAKRGTFVRVKRECRKFTQKEMEVLPPHHQARSNPDLMVERRKLVVESSPILTKLEHPLDWLFSENKE